MPKDSHLVKDIISIWDPTSWLANHRKRVTNVEWEKVKKAAPKKGSGRKGKGRSVSTKKR